MSLFVSLSTLNLISISKPSFTSLPQQLLSFPSPSATSFYSNRAVRLVTSATAAKVTPGTVKREPRGITKPKRVSNEMREFLGVEEIPRTQALKEIWAYIKKHDLQDPENKKIIICDQKLKTIFAGKDRVGFLEIAGLISPHFL